MRKMNQAEVVYCKCGAMIAACVMGYQSAEWHKDLRKYMQKGYVIKHIPAGEVRLDFGACTCNTNKGDGQLSMF